MKKIGFLGLGLMGSRMAKNLAKKGFEVHVWNRTPLRAQQLMEHGVVPQPTPRAVAEAVDAYCTCVANPAALREVSDGLLAGARKGSCSSTSRPCRAR